MVFSYCSFVVRFEGVAGDSSGSGTSDSRDGAYAATPSAAIL